MRTVQLLTVLLCLCVAGTAQAGWRIERAQAIAEQVWHHPCGGHVRLAWADLPDTGIAESSAASFVDQCLIVYSREPTHWAEFCTTMIHEYGHLAGYRDWSNTADPLHSSNPHSVMAQNTISVDAATYGTVHGHKQWTHVYVGLDKRCADNGRIYLGMKPDALAGREKWSR